MSETPLPPPTRSTLRRLFPAVLFMIALIGLMVFAYTADYTPPPSASDSTSAVVSLQPTAQESSQLPFQTKNTTKQTPRKILTVAELHARYNTLKAEVAKLAQDSVRSKYRDQWLFFAHEFYHLYNNNPRWPNRPAALFRSAEVLETLGVRSFAQRDYQAAVERYEQLSQEFATSILADDALLRASILWHEKLDNTAKALVLLTKLQTQYPHGDMVKKAVHMENLLRANASLPRENIITSSEIAQNSAHENISTAQKLQMQQEQLALEREQKALKEEQKNLEKEQQSLKQQQKDLEQQQRVLEKQQQELEQDQQKQKILEQKRQEQEALAQKQRELEQKKREQEILARQEKEAEQIRHEQVTLEQQQKALEKNRKEQEALEQQQKILEQKRKESEQKQREQEIFKQKQQEQAVLEQKRREQEILKQKQQEQEALEQRQQEQAALEQKKHELEQKQKELEQKKQEQEALEQRQQEQAALEQKKHELEQKQKELEQKKREQEALEQRRQEQAALEQKKHELEQKQKELEQKKREQEALEQRRQEQAALEQRKHELEQKQKELEQKKREQEILEQKQKELDKKQRELEQEQQKQKELERKQKELEQKQRVLEQRQQKQEALEQKQKELEQRQKELEQTQQKQKELEQKQRDLEQKQKELEKKQQTQAAAALQKAQENSNVPTHIAPWSEELAKTVKTANMGNIAAQLGLGVRTVFIDAGHGGKDPGAVHNGLVERDIVLDLSKRLGRILTEKGLQVVYSRTEDVFLALSARPAHANTVHADLFLSIHVNAHEDTSIHGFETFYLNLAQNERAAYVAALENRSSDRNLGDMQSVLAKVMLHTRIDESSHLAQCIQRMSIAYLTKKNYSIKNGGTRSAPFHVLIGTHMPAVLVEVGYISHQREATALKNAQYREDIAHGIAEGIMMYKHDLEAIQ